MSWKCVLTSPMKFIAFGNFQLLRFVRENGKLVENALRVLLIVLTVREKTPEKRKYELDERKVWVSTSVSYKLFYRTELNFPSLSYTLTWSDEFKYFSSNGSKKIQNSVIFFSVEENLLKQRFCEKELLKAYKRFRREKRKNWKESRFE